MIFCRKNWFWEEWSVAGRWSPVASETKPAVTTSDSGVLRLVKIGGVGPRIRREPQEIDVSHRHLRLDDLQSIYGGGQ